MPSDTASSCAAAPEAIVAAARKAAKQLRGLRMCADGREEHVTHLILGAERRTIKVPLSFPRHLLMQ